MVRTLDRRTWLGGALALAAAAATTAAPGSPASATPSRPRPPVPLFKISLAQWSLHRSIFAQEVNPLHFARVANELGFDAIEYVNQFFKDKARDRSYLADLKQRAAGEGVWSVLIMIDREGRLGDPDATKRTQAIESHKPWVDAAAYLGCHSIRVNAASDGSYDEQAKLAADGLRRLSEYGDSAGINVIVENHGGLSSNGAWLAQVMKTVAHPRCGTLPDFGNFQISKGENYDPYRGVAELMPFAKSVSAKAFDFDRRGQETRIDFLRMMKLVVAAGYHGYVGVEYEGERLPERKGILATKALLERTRRALTPRR